MYQIFSLEHHPLLIKELNLSLEYSDLIDLFDSCDKVIVIACNVQSLQINYKEYYSHLI